MRAVTKVSLAILLVAIVYFIFFFEVETAKVESIEVDEDFEPVPVETSSGT